MKKSYLMLAAVAALFAACSSGSDDVAERPSVQNSITDQVPVSFDTYVNRGTTRAGLTGEIKDDAATLRTSGFGVFAYYTNADNYDQTFTPNFMYNQHVTYSSDWTYTPVKYWPNEFGSGALSDDVDKVSFFAYAPYVTVNPTSGKVNGNGSTYPQDDGGIEMGIVGMKNNNTTGDPMVKYISTFYTDKQVDLVWGTQIGDWNIKQTEAAQTGVTAGKPWLDVQHPKATAGNQRLQFNFQHSLAALNVTVDTKANSADPTTVSEPTKTKIFIRSVTFEGFDTKGALNLNNTIANTALWYNFDCNNELNNGAEVTIQDGRKDGKEGLTAATKEYAAINPTFVQSNVWGYTQPGVTGTANNLFAKLNGGIFAAPDAKTDPIYVIPNGDKLKVTIEYDVMTTDGNLAGTLNDGVTKGSVVKNVITRYITNDGTKDLDGTSGKCIILTNGKKYTITLHLALNSVEFTASVTGWTGPDNGSADLPHNN